MLRANAWRVRGPGTDAVDLWRALEIAWAARVPLDEQGVEGITRASPLIRDAFLSPGTALDSPGENARPLARGTDANADANKGPRGECRRERLTRWMAVGSARCGKSRGDAIGQVLIGRWTSLRARCDFTSLRGFEDGV